MPIQITCGRCQASYPVDDDLRGRRVRCRECGEPVVVEGPFAAAGEEAPRLDPAEAANHPPGLALSGVRDASFAPPPGALVPLAQPLTTAVVPAAEVADEMGEGPGNDLPPGRPPRKSRRTALLVGITALGLIGLLAGAWAWDLFGLRSRWAPPTPPAVLSWHMPDRIDDLAFGGTLPAKEREAGKTLLVVEVQLPRQLLDGRSGWLEWSVAFHGADLSLVTPDGQASPPLLVTAIDPVGGPPVPSWPPGFGNQDRWIPGSGSARVRGQRPAPERFKVKAAFVVLQSSVRAGGLPRPIQGRPVRAVPAKRCTV
jgi:predicted Zn finger-like uncharacterized protein